MGIPIHRLIKKNPLVKMDKKEYELVSDGKIKGEVENVRFAASAGSK